MLWNDADWENEFDRWLKPFLAAWRHKTRQRWAPVYLRGLLAPGERKSIEPLAARVSPNNAQQLHHFIAVSKWDTSELEQVPFEKADSLVGGAEAHLIVDDTAQLKKGDHSVGVAHQYCGQVGKNANCQALVSLTLARNEVPVPIVLRLYLPESWAKDTKRRSDAGVPGDVAFRPKWKIALGEIKRVIDAGVRFADVWADAGYGACGEFRQGLTARADVGRGHIARPTCLRTRSTPASSAEKVACEWATANAAIGLASAPLGQSTSSKAEGKFETIAWRQGTKKLPTGRLRRPSRTSCRRPRTYWTSARTRRGGLVGMRTPCGRGEEVLLREPRN